MSAPDYTSLLGALTSLAREAKAIDPKVRRLSFNCGSAPMFDALLSLGSGSRTAVYRDGQAIDTATLTVAGVEFESQLWLRPATAEEMAALGDRENATARRSA